GSNAKPINRGCENNRVGFQNRIYGSLNTVFQTIGPNTQFFQQTTGSAVLSRRAIDCYRSFHCITPDAFEPNSRYMFQDERPRTALIVPRSMRRLNRSIAKGNVCYGP